ncbi:MAG: hypothetical protein ACREGA_02060 [Candidatus Saccharimonadales bacterium]
MNSYETPDSKFEQERAAINQRAAEKVGETADLQRRELIDAAFSGMLAYLTFQQARMDKLADEGRLGAAAFDRTVLQTFAHLPFGDDDEPHNAFSLLLQPDKNLGQERRGEEKIMVYMPVPEDVTLQSGFDPNSLERPGYIVVERYDEAGQARSYIISDDKAEEFQSAYSDSEGEQLTGEEVEIIHMGEHLSRRVNPIDAVIGEIFTELTDWTVQVQRSDEA